MLQNENKSYTHINVHQFNSNQYKFKVHQFRKKFTPEQATPYQKQRLTRKRKLHKTPIKQQHENTNTTQPQRRSKIEKKENRSRSENLQQHQGGKNIMRYPLLRELDHK